MLVIILILVLTVALLLAVLLISQRDKNRFVTEHYEFNDERVAGDFSFVMLSDLHNKDYGNHNQNLISAIRSLHPDFIIMAGDIMTARAGEDFTNAVELVLSLASEYEIYYGLGNHEHRAGLYLDEYGTLYQDYRKRIQNPHVHILDNSSVCLHKYGIQITGLTLDRIYYKRFRKTKMEKNYLSGLIGNRDEKVYEILIAHNPQYFKEYSEWGAPLVLSGHIHGGVVRLPLMGGVASPAIQFFPRYDSGEFQRGASSMIVSRGLGTHTIPIRMWNPGEISHITIHGSAKQPFDSLH